MANFDDSVIVTRSNQPGGEVFDAIYRRTFKVRGERKRGLVCARNSLVRVGSRFTEFAGGSVQCTE
jgi:hypothetical protein